MENIQEVERKNNLSLLIYHILRNKLNIPHENLVSLNISYLNSWAVISLPISVNGIVKWEDLTLLHTLTKDEIEEALIQKFKNVEFPLYPTKDNLDDSFFSEIPVKKHIVNLLKDSDGLSYVKVNDKITLLESDEYVITQYVNQEYVIKGFSSITTYLNNPSTNVKIICKI